jgi:hypothetical protein
VSKSLKALQNLKVGHMYENNRANMRRLKMKLESIDEDDETEIKSSMKGITVIDKDVM